MITLVSGPLGNCHVELCDIYESKTVAHTIPLHYWAFLDALLRMTLATYFTFSLTSTAFESDTLHFHPIQYRQINIDGKIFTPS